MNAPRRRLSPAALLLLLAASCGNTDVSQPFAPGQVWRYDTRPTETESRLTVCKIEQHEELGEIVHVKLENLAISNPRAEQGVTHTINHAPFLADALRQSLVALDDTLAEPPDQQADYEAWLAAHERGDAVIFSIPVKDCIAGIAELIDR